MVQNMRLRSTSEKLLLSTVRIEILDDPDAVGYGTGFFFQRTSPIGPVTFLVTNKHVVQGASRAQIVVTRRDGNLPLIGKGQLLTFKNFESRWHSHPDPNIDICVMPFGPVIAELEKEHIQIAWSYISDSIIPSDEPDRQLDAIESIQFIGYPIALADEFNKTPLIRQGITATPYALDYEGQPLLLIDASVFPGSSGSPVVTLLQSPLALGSSGEQLTYRYHFLGVISHTILVDREGQVKTIKIPMRPSLASIVANAIHIGVVQKARSVVEAADDFLRSISTTIAS